MQFSDINEKKISGKTSTAASRGRFFRYLLERESLKWEEAAQRIESAHQTLRSGAPKSMPNGQGKGAAGDGFGVTEEKIKRWKQNGGPKSGDYARAIRQAFGLGVGTENLDFYLGKREFVPLSAAQSGASEQPDSEIEIEEDGDRFLHSYCKQLISRLEWIDVLGKKSFGGGNQQLRLDSVFTALRAEMFSAAERAAAHSLFHDTRHSDAAWKGNPDVTVPRAFDPIKTMPIMRGIAGHEETVPIGQAPIGKRANLAEMVSENQILVILGEPASGKTTMLKWLAIRFAEDWLASRGKSKRVPASAAVTVDIQQVDPFSDEHKQVVIGPTRLPIFLSLQEIASELAKRPTADLFAAIASRLLGTVKPQGQPGGAEDTKILPGAALEKELRALAANGELIVLLDGLDEVPDQTARKAAIDVIAEFQRGYLSPSGIDTSVGGQARFPSSQLVVTSRIVGYHSLPLPNDWPHAVVERMTKGTVKRYWRRLHQAVDLTNSETSQSDQDPVEALHDKVFNSERRGVDELAGIPLLATLLALIFKADGTLPNRRVEIYDRALSHLVEEWGEDRRPRSREANLSNWKQLLCVVAREMHDSPAQSLLHRDELIEILVKRQIALNDRSGGVRLRGDPEALARELLKDNNDAVGILIERADGYFSFLHRTFQEYLASIWLLDEAGHGSERIASRMDDPRWREPVLLAFGHATLHGDAKREVRDRLIRQMIATTEPGLAVRRARFIALATADMASLPSIDVYTDLLDIVLSGTDGRRLQDLPEAQRIDIEDAVFAMADRDAELFERALARLLTSSTGAVRASAAHLIADNRWRTQALLEALQAAEVMEDGQFGYAAARALGIFRTALAFPETAEGLDEREAPLTPEDIDEIDFDEQARHSSPEAYSRLLERVARLRSEYPRRLRRWRVHNQLAEPQIRHPKRDSLWQDIERISQEPAERAVAIALHGGLGDYGNQSIHEDYRTLAAFLQEDDRKREIYVDEKYDLLLRFGVSDPIYKTAVFLDTLGGSRINRGKVVPVFDLNQSLLTDQSLLLAGMGKSRWASDVQTATTSAKAQGVRALATILRATQGEIDLQAFVNALDKSARAELNDAARRSAVLVSDAAFRAFQGLTRSIPSEVVSVGKAHHEAFAIALETAASILPSTPIGFTSWKEFSDRASCEDTVFALAGLHLDNSIHEAAVTLERLEKLPLRELACQLRFLSSTVQGPWIGECFSLDQGSVWPQTNRNSDVSPALIDEAMRWNLGEISIDLSFALVNVLVKKLVESDDPEAALSVLPLVGYIPTDDFQDHKKMPAQRLLKKALTARDPYWRARGLLVIAEAGIADFDLAKIRASADKISDPIEQFIVLERLAALGVGIGNGELWTAVISAARAIPDPEQRWRALCNLIKSGAGSRDDLIAELADALDALPGLWERVQAWADAQRILGGRLLMARQAGASRQIPLDGSADEHQDLGDCALRGYSAPTIFLLCEIGALTMDAALALYVARASIDIQRALDIAETVDVVQRRRQRRVELPASPEPALSVHSDSDDEPNGEIVNLTAAAAQQILDAYKVDRKHAVRLSDRFSIRSLSALNAASAWLDHPGSPFARRAALEFGRRTHRRDCAIIEPLLRAMASEDDEAKVMAADVLMRGSNAVKRLPRVFRARDVGLAALMTAGEFAADPSQSHVALAARIFLYDIVHDDPDIVEELFIFASISDEKGSIARLVLAEMGEASLDVEILIRNSFVEAPQAVKIALLTGLSARSHSDPHFSRQEIAPWLREVATQISDPIRFLPEYVGDVVSAVRQSIAANKLISGDPVAEAQRILEGHYADLREIFQIGNDAEIIAALKAYTDLRHSQGIDARPVRDGSDQLESLLNSDGPLAVRTLTAWLRQCLLAGNTDAQVLSALAFATVQCCQRFPDQVALAFFGSGGMSGVQGASPEKHLLKAIHKVIQEDTTGVAGASLLALLASFWPVQETEAEYLMNAALSVDPVSERRLENILRAIRGVSENALVVLEDALSSPSPRKQRVAIRLLGVLLRTPGNSGESLRTATSQLTRFAYTTDGKARPLGIASRSENGEGAFYFRHHSLSESALRELRRSWS